MLHFRDQDKAFASVRRFSEQGRSGHHLPSDSAKNGLLHFVGRRLRLRAQMPFARRVFLVTLIAVCAAISVTFITVNMAIRLGLEAGIKQSLRRSEDSVEQARAGQNARPAVLLRWMAEEPAFDAAVNVATNSHCDPRSRAHALRTIEQRLRAMRELVASDFEGLADPQGNLIAYLQDGGTPVRGLDARRAVLGSGLTSIGGNFYSIFSQPVQIHDRHAATLLIGRRFDLSGFDRLGPAGLLYRGRLIRSTFPPEVHARIERELDPDCVRRGCELHSNSANFLVMPVSRAAAGVTLGDDFQLLSFRSLDTAMSEITRHFRMLLPAIGVCIVLVAICISALASRSVSRPLKELVDRIERGEAADTLRPGFPENSPTLEINRLAASLNRAAAALKQSNGRLDRASIEFVETMAQALDARDPYTAGHSRRVRDYSVAIAEALCLPAGEIEIIGVGAQMHDIGKIGIPDSLLRKAGHLAEEEFDLIKLHPQIGKRILERVGHFEKYLPIVELHHENYDGSGYPYALREEQIPLAVRIVRVADVYDALTTNRAYRDAMPAARAREIVRSRSGSQFDPEVVHAFLAVLDQKGDTELLDLQRLAGIASD